MTGSKYVSVTDLAQFASDSYHLAERTTMLVIKAFASWLILMVLAILNGSFRQSVLLQRMDELRAHQVSTIMLCAIIFLYTWLIYRWWQLPSRSSAWIVGLTWLVLTVAFEFVLGGVILKKPMSTMLADYNILVGRIWPLVLLSVLLAPVALWRANQ